MLQTVFYPENFFAFLLLVFLLKLSRRISPVIFECFAEALNTRIIEFIRDIGNRQCTLRQKELCNLKFSYSVVFFDRNARIFAENLRKVIVAVVKTSGYRFNIFDFIKMRIYISDCVATKREISETVFYVFFKNIGKGNDESVYKIGEDNIVVKP